ncbi:MAG: MmcQ/YjbR family DNA-binding protein [Oscillospiraceae bacterium]|nr:MmcQ/YjbR family DNA-binding protein [Oscillospiraceae bacterium]
MTDMTEIFKHKKLVKEKLIPFGFEIHPEQHFYDYQKILPGSDFILTVRISEQGEIFTEVIDPVLHEPYILHLTDAVGEFVGNVREQCQKILSEIAENCFIPDVFQNPQSKQILAYVRETYGDELEFLWKKFDDNAILRRKDSQKWYAVLMTIAKRKLGMDSDQTVEIIDLRIQPEQIESLIDDQNYFPGWHMNKKHWYTIILDHSVPTEELCRRIDESYLLAKK